MPLVLRQNLDRPLTISELDGNFTYLSQSIVSPSSSISASYAVTASYALSASYAPGGSDTNFANANLTFTGNRTHDTNGNGLYITTDNEGYAEGYLTLDQTGITAGGEGSSYFSLGNSNGTIILSNPYQVISMAPNDDVSTFLTPSTSASINIRSTRVRMSGSIQVTGSLTINDILQLKVRTTNPGAPVEGMIIASGSVGASKLYYYNGSSWIDLTA